MRTGAWHLVLAAALVEGCAAPAPSPVVVVGFRADVGDTKPGRVLVSPDGESFGIPTALGNAGDWLVDVRDRGDTFEAIDLGGNVYESDASGENWTRRHVHSSWLDALSFSADDPAVGFLSGAGRFWRTDDAGATWIPRDPPGYYFEDFVVRDAREAVGVEGYLSPARGVVWSTTNGGASWTDALELPAGLRAIGSPAPSAFRELWAAGDGGVLATTTSGTGAWHLYERPPDEGAAYRPNYSAIDFASPRTGYIVGDGGVIRRYRPDARLAKRWEFRVVGNYVLQGVFARDERNAFACGYVTHTDLGVVLRTRDGGESWSVVATTPGIFWYGIRGKRT